VLTGFILQAAEALLAAAVLLHPLARERARLNLGEQAAHAPLRLVVDDRRPARHIAVLRRVRDRVAHLGDSALVDEIDDELHLVQALEVGHLRRVARLDQSLEPRLNQRREAAAQNGLLAEEVCLSLLAEIRLDDSGAPASDSRGVGEAEPARVARL